MDYFAFRPGMGNDPHIKTKDPWTKYLVTQRDIEIYKDKKRAWIPLGADWQREGIIPFDPSSYYRVEEYNDGSGIFCLYNQNGLNEFYVYQKSSEFARMLSNSGVARKV